MDCISYFLIFLVTRHSLLVTRYQHYVFGKFVKSPKTFSVGIVTLNGFSDCRNVLKP